MNLNLHNSIFNRQAKSFFNRRKSGFTLIEILVVVALLGIASVVTTQIFFTILNSQSKSEITKEVKQNGDYALSVMSQMTRNAQDVNCTGSGTSYTIINNDNGSTTFDCSSTHLSSNSSFLTGNNVDITSCNINVICPTPPTNPKYVYINFSLTQHGPTGAPEQNASENFQTTISLRNYR